MDLSRERTMILEMIANGKITVDEGEELIKALHASVRRVKPVAAFPDVPELPPLEPLSPVPPMPLVPLMPVAPPIRPVLLLRRRRCDDPIWRASWVYPQP